MNIYMNQQFLFLHALMKFQKYHETFIKNLCGRFLCFYFFRKIWIPLFVVNVPDMSFFVGQKACTHDLSITCPKLTKYRRDLYFFLPLKSRRVFFYAPFLLFHHVCPSLRFIFPCHFYFAFLLFLLLQFSIYYTIQKYYRGTQIFYLLYLTEDFLKILHFINLD